MTKAKTKANKTQALPSHFPHISRFIPAKPKLKAFLSQGFVALVLVGVVFFVLLNLVVSYRQPAYLKELLKNPGNVEALSMVLAQNKQPELDIYLKDYLQTISGIDKVRAVEKLRVSQRERVAKIENLLRQYPAYPDGYAYLAVLFYNQHDCREALWQIDQALALDSSRKIFQELKTKIVSCQQ